MIPYEELVTALAHWRARQGLPPLYNIEYLGVQKHHRIDTSSAFAGREGAIPPRSRARSEVLEVDEEAMLVDTGMLDLDDSPRADSYADDLVEPPAPASPSYAPSDYAVESATAQFDPSLGHGEPASRGWYGDTAGEYGAAPAAPASYYSQRPSLGEEGEESTAIHGPLGPASMPTAMAQALSWSGAPAASGIPDEPVYDSLAAAAEYQAEQDYAADHQAGGPGEPTRAFSAMDAWSPQGNAYGPTTGYAPVEPAGYAPVEPAGYAHDFDEPPPLEPPPEEDEYGFPFDEDK